MSIVGLFKTGSHPVFEINLKIACPLHIAAEYVRTCDRRERYARRVESPLWWNLPAARHLGPASGVGALPSLAGPPVEWTRPRLQRWPLSKTPGAAVTPATAVPALS